MRYPQNPGAVRTEAIQAVERGWPVIAVDRVRYGNGDWGWPQTGPVTRDLEEVAARFGEGGAWHGKASAFRNPDGVVKVDVDPHHGGNLNGHPMPKTVTIRTPNDGAHYLVTVDDIPEDCPSWFVYAQGIDVIVNGTNPLPGAQKAEGEYAWLIHPDEAGIAPAPDWLIDAIRAKAKEQQHATEQRGPKPDPSTLDVTTLTPRLRQALEDPVEPGQRSTRFAYVVRAGVEDGLTDAEIWAYVNAHPPSVSKYGDRSDFWQRTSSLIGEHRPRTEPLPHVVELERGGVVFDAPATPESLWGSKADCLAALGEPTMLYSATGIGKTTLAQRLGLAAVGIGPPELLGYPVRQIGGRVLYVAADRPSQAMRSLRRMVRPEDRLILDEWWRLERRRRIRITPDRPETLAEWAEKAGATLIILDSVKDLVSRVSDDESGQAFNDAVQTCVANGIEVVSLHHPRKAGGDNTRAFLSLDDVYGSTWVTAGHGSVIALNGKAGEGIARLQQLKMPAEEVGPFDVDFDYLTGTLTTLGKRDLATWLGQQRTTTAREAFSYLFGKNWETGTDAEHRKIRRKLNQLVRDGMAQASGGDGHLKVWRWAGPTLITHPDKTTQEPGHLPGHVPGHDSSEPGQATFEDAGNPSSGREPTPGQRPGQTRSRTRTKRPPLKGGRMSGSAPVGNEENTHDDLLDPF